MFHRVSWAFQGASVGFKCVPRMLEGISRIFKDSRSIPKEFKGFKGVHENISQTSLKP